jgi:hypothetical protein
MLLTWLLLTAVEILMTLLEGIVIMIFVGSVQQYGMLLRLLPIWHSIDDTFTDYGMEGVYILETIYLWRKHYSKSDWYHSIQFRRDPIGPLLVIRYDLDPWYLLTDTADRWRWWRRRRADDGTGSVTWVVRPDWRKRRLADGGLTASSWPGSPGQPLAYYSGSEKHWRQPSVSLPQNGRAFDWLWRGWLWRIVDWVLLLLLTSTAHLRPVCVRTGTCLCRLTACCCARTATRRIYSRTVLFSIDQYCVLLTTTVCGMPLYGI